EHERVAEPDDPEFARWLHDISPESFEDGAFISDAWRTWLQTVYADQGPISRVEVEAQALRQMTAVAQDALTAVLDDAERALTTRPPMEVVHNEGLRIAYRQQRASLSFVTEEPPAALSTPDDLQARVEVAEAVI